MQALTQLAIFGWLWRRVQELASAAAGLVPLYLALPPTYQELITGILQGKGGGYSISLYLGFAYYLFTQWQSLKATTKPQVVTDAGVKINTVKDLPSAKKVLVEEVATAAAEKKAATRQPNILEKLFGRKS